MSLKFLYTFIVLIVLFDSVHAMDNKVLPQATEIKSMPLETKYTDELFKKYIEGKILDAAGLDELIKIFEVPEASVVKIAFPLAQQNSGAPTNFAHVPIAAEIINSGFFPTLQAACNFSIKDNSMILLSESYSPQTIFLLKKLIYLMHFSYYLMYLVEKPHYPAEILKATDPQLISALENFLEKHEHESFEAALNDGFLDLVHAYDDLKPVAYACMRRLSSLVGKDDTFNIDMPFPYFFQFAQDPKSAPFIARLLAQKLERVRMSSDDSEKQFAKQASQECLDIFERDIYEIARQDDAPKPTLRLTPDLEELLKKRIIEKHAVPNFARIARLIWDAGFTPTKALRASKNVILFSGAIEWWQRAYDLTKREWIDDLNKVHVRPRKNMPKDYMPDIMTIFHDRILMSFESGAIRSFDEAGQHMREYEYPYVRVRPIGLLLKQGIMAASYADSTIQIWQNDQRREFKIAEQEGKKLTAMAMASCEKGLLAVGKGATVYILDISNGNIVARLHEKHRANELDEITELCLLNEHYLVAGSKTGRVCIWDLARKKVVKIIQRADESELEGEKPQPAAIIGLASWNSVLEIIYGDGVIERVFIPELASLQDLLLRLKNNKLNEAHNGK